MDSQLDFVARNAEIARRVHARVSVDLAYTPRELEELRELPFFVHVLATGKVLYERKSA